MKRQKVVKGELKDGKHAVEYLVELRDSSIIEIMTLDGEREIGAVKIQLVKGVLYLGAREIGNLSKEVIIEL